MVNIRNIIFSIGTVFLTSCSSMDNRQSISFRPAIDAEYEYKIENSDEVRQEIDRNENSTRVIVRCTAQLLYKIMQKSDAGYVVSVKFISSEIENISAASNLPGHDSTYFHKNINSLDSTVFKLNLFLDGRIEKLDGYQDYLKKVSKSHEKEYSEKYFLDIFSRISQILPKDSVFVGSSWRNRAVHDNGIEYLTNDYKVEKKDRGRAFISISSEVKQEIVARNTTLLMSGLERGKIEIEDKTGMPIKSSRTLELKGSSNVGGVKILQYSLKTSKLIGTRIEN